MKPHRTLLFLMAFSLLPAACSNPEAMAPQDWGLTEPLDEPPAQTPPEDAQDSTEDADSTAPEEELLQPPERGPWSLINCDNMDPEFWSFEDLAVQLYRQLYCQKEDHENIIFSPASIYISLAETAESLAPQDAQNISNRLGLSSIEELIEHAKSYRTDILTRRPKGGRSSGASEWRYYTIEERDEERLNASLGIDLYTAHCSESDPQDEQNRCNWVSQNGLWDQSFLEHHPPPDQPDSDIQAQAMILRGQFVHGYSPRRPNSLSTPFKVPDGRQYPIRFFSGGAYRYLREGEDLVIAGDRFVGDEISLLLILPLERPLPEIEASLSTEQIRYWAQAMQQRSVKYAPRVRIPPFDIAETVEIKDLLEHSDPLHHTTRLSFAEAGINSPEPIKFIYDPPRIAITGERNSLPTYQFDNPFLFIVYDHPTQSILLMGRVANPADGLDPAEIKDPREDEPNAPNLWD